MEFRAGFLGSESPMDGDLGGIALLLQGLDSLAEGGFVWDTPPEAGASQHAKLYLRHVEPTTAQEDISKGIILGPVWRHPDRSKERFL